MNEKEKQLIPFSLPPIIVNMDQECNRLVNTAEDWSEHIVGGSSEGRTWSGRLVDELDRWLFDRKKSLKENKETIDFKFEPNNSFTFFHSSHTKHNAKISPFLSNFLVFLLIVSTFYQMEIYY